MTERLHYEKKRNFLRHKSEPKPTSIVPEGDVTGQALVVVIAIMTFLASLALSGVDLIAQSARNWETQVSQEATIQVRPSDGLDIEKTLKYAVEIAQGFEGVKSAKIVDRAATQRLLEPWLGTGLELDELPIPRLIVVTFTNPEAVDFGMMSDAISTQIPGASFDDHRNAINRLVSMAHTTVFIGMVVLVLVLAALVLTVIFATRSALSANSHVVEVLHFIGAESRFVARQFDFHFLKTGLKGSLYGGCAAILIILGFSFWSHQNMGTPEADQAIALFGNFTIRWISYSQIIILIGLVAFLTMMTSRLTILNQLHHIDRRESDLF
ncbi:cell division protein FtsX [Bartonella tamiae]|uniref:Cell division protein FtsX n=1 Tax=Bartonella tamiae Th239 TaxID=1094558 RepID=J0R708_9HYPH|nr:ABC transporter permease [Bartonella tamiae]EJF91499.1 hypothetical protein ME5_00194 [Bartonella tamiae Th239]EJF92517.1 hypothetical protein MEG_01687 [Bartonella tamiae Th307]